MTTPKLIPIDIPVTGQYHAGDPFGASLYGTFTNGATQLTIPGFYLGNGTWAVRFSAQEEGQWAYTIHSKDIAFSGETAGCITVSCEASGAVYPLQTKGTRFVDSRGQSVFILGHECNFLFALAGSENGPEKLRIFIENLKKGGFNKVQVNSYAVDTSWQRGRTCENDYGPPPISMWLENDGQRLLNPAYFKAYDYMVDQLNRNGIYISIYLRVYNKFVQWPEKYSAEETVYYTHFAARYQAYPNVLWDISKEGYYEHDRRYHYDMISRVRALDGYHRLCTIHDDSLYALDPRYAHTIDYLTIQQHGEFEHSVMYYAQRSGKPVIIGEAGQECGPGGVLDTISFPCWSPDQFCANALETYMCGGYWQYYSVYMAWDIIEYDYLPTGYRFFRQMKDFFEQFDLSQFRAAPELAPMGGSTQCMDNGKDTALFLIEPPGYERYLCYNFGYIPFHPEDNGMKVLSYQRFGLFSGKTLDYDPSPKIKDPGSNYFDQENKTHMEAVRRSVMLAGSKIEPVVIIVRYKKE